MSALFLPLQKTPKLSEAPRIEGVYGTAADFLAAFRAQNRISVMILPDDRAAQKSAERMGRFYSGPVMHFAGWDIISHDIDTLSDKILTKRTQVMRALSETPKSLLITTSLEAMAQRIMAPKRFGAKMLQFNRGMEIERGDLVTLLDGAGLNREMTVSQEGQYAVKGAVVDIWPFSTQEPVRLEFFDDEIDSLRTFDAETQLTVQKLKTYSLHEVPSHELKQAVFDETAGTLLDYLPADALVGCWDLDALQAQHAGGPTGEILGLTDAFERVNFCPYISNQFPDAIKVKTHDIENTPKSSENLLSLLRDRRFPTVIFCDDEPEMDRMKALITGKLEHVPLSFTLGHLDQGVVFDDFEIAIISANDIVGSLGANNTAGRRIPKKERANISSFADLEEGDYVVHTMHGVGRYMMLDSLVRPDGTCTDCLLVLYADNQRLMVPMNNLYLVQKYIGPTDDGEITLDKIGAPAWQKKKNKAQKSIEKMAHELLQLQAEREKYEGYACEVDGETQRHFEHEFAYEDTPDQATTTAEIKFDMESPRPMDRLLCGDVGFGKTEMAMRAAFKAVTNGRQVAVLVPTTILAEQHYRSFTERMKNFPIMVETMNRFRTTKEQKATAERLKRGTVDIVIGTHRLLSKDVEFKNLGLAIIDEEQRFGVKAKEHLKTLRSTVDVLTMSATPIPRTLHMGFMTIKDISVLKTPPRGRLAINTHVVPFEEDIIERAVQKEIDRGGQVFFVQDRVHSIPTVVKKLQELFPKERIDILHGQMPTAQAEKSMMNFLQGNSRILVATTIIESGLDIPNVNTIFINNADNYGLAELHQLRGRIGRYKYDAYAYFLIKPDRKLTERSQKRLKAIANFSELGAGFNLAMQDMEIRGAGNLLGKQQHGHIEEIGYELYCQMLQDTVKVLKGEVVQEEIEVRINLGQDAFIPDTYIADHRHKIEIYRWLAEAKSLEAIDDYAYDMLDRFGRYPEPVRALIEESKIVLLARELRITKIYLQGGLITLSTEGLDIKSTVTSMARHKWEIAKVTDKVIAVKPRDSSISSQVRMMLQGMLEYRAEMLAAAGQGTSASADAEGDTTDATSVNASTPA